MAKASDSRHSGRRGAPKTIDLTASVVKAAESGAEPRPHAETQVPPAEPVAFDQPRSQPAAAEPAEQAGETMHDEASASAPEDELPTPPIGTERRSGFGSIAAGAIAGAIVAALIAGGLVATGMLGGSQDNGLADRTAALEQQLAALEKTTSDRSEANKLATEIQGLTSRLTQSEQALEQLQQITPNTNVDDSRLSDLSTRIDDLSAQLDAARTEITRIRQAPSDGSQPVDPAALAGLQSRIEALETAGNGVSDNLQALQGRVDKVEQTANDAAQQQQTAAKQTSAAITLAGNALTAAYDRGEPFLELLSSLEDLVGESPAIDALKPYGDSGVSTINELKRGFADLTGTILSTAEPQDEGVFNRLMANARSLVEVRPAGPTEGDTPPAIVSRIEADLDAGDLNQAYSEWQSLPDAARAISQGWADRLNARMAADQALNKVLTEFGLPANGGRS